jgi:hypothetical protein
MALNAVILGTERPHELHETVSALIRDRSAPTPSKTERAESFPDVTQFLRCKVERFIPGYPFETFGSFS